MRRAGILLVVLVMLAAGCSGDDSSPDAAGDPTTTSSHADTTGPTTTTRAERTPAVTPAVLEGPITAGEFAGPADPRPVDLSAIGYVQEEFFASGDATAYTGDASPTTDGHWEVTASTTAPYRTRIVVRRPADPARFDGTVVVEWLNVTVVETAPEWAYIDRAIVDAGAAWVGVSAQSFGIVGGRSLIQVEEAEQQAQASGGIRAANPERYGTLEHPGDQYAFDIYSQIGAALRAPAGIPVLGAGAGETRFVVAAGESQSAAFLTGYVNAVQPLANAFDGFFVHSRGAGAAFPGGGLAMNSDTGYQIRTDLDAPVMVFQTETDVGPLLGFAKARQPDTDNLRVWEVAGTAHADAYLVGANFPLCPGGINDGPQHYVATAALDALLRWVEDGTPPPHADPIETEAPASTVIVRDTHGIAQGGIRTPSVDAPVATLSGEAPPDTELLCALFGGSTSFDQAKLTTLYPDKQAYLDAFDEALDSAVDQGFVRAADREQYAAEARAITW
jgi:hypothetical protein